MSGYLIINKPKNLNSFGIIRKIKKEFPGRKVGYSGTLDFFASGVLPVLIDEATKTSDIITGFIKKYKALVKFGIETDTLDRTGSVIMEKGVNFTESDLRGTFKDFIGLIDQLPPKYSSIKIKGKRASDIIRSGCDVKMKPRSVKIDKIELLEFRDNGMAVLEITCHKGTYIRALARDIAYSLDTVAYLLELERISVGNFYIENAVHPDSVKDGDIVSLNSGLALLPVLYIKGEYIEKFNNGVKLKDDFFMDDLDICNLNENDYYRVINKENDIIIGIVKIFEGKLRYHCKFNTIAQ